jgi:hypothetical protein
MKAGGIGKLQTLPSHPGTGRLDLAEPDSRLALRFGVISLERRAGNIEMDSEKVAGILGAIVASVVLVIAIAYGPIGQMGKPAKPVQKIEAPAQPAAPAVRGPVVREVPQ